MNKITYFLSVMCLAVCLAFQSCDDGDGYSLGDFTAPQLATVRSLGGSAFYLDCDVWGTCWPVNTDLGWFVPVDGQRVITVFNPLWDNFEGYDHAVNILEMQKVLTQNVELMAAGEEDKYGTEGVPTAEDGVTIGNGYMNVYFRYRLPATTRVSLVYRKDDLTQTTTTAGPSEDGYIHLELRCNTQSEEQTPGSYSMVSYNLGTLSFPDGFRGIRLKVNLEGEGEKEWVYTLVQEGDY